MFSTCARVTRLMHGPNRTFRHSNQPLPKAEAPGRAARAILISLGCLVGLFNHLLHGWGYAAAPACVALVLPIIGYRKYWRQSRFWITVTLLAVIQPPLVVVLKPVLDQFRFLAMFTFGVVDCVLVTLAISWVCSLSDEDEDRQTEGMNRN
jgi:hypothetical protein